MKCTECGNATTKSVGDHVYRESGLDNVILRNTTKYTCESCGAVKVQIVAMGPLHRAIAHAIAIKPTRFMPKEVRFLRDHLDLGNKEFAELMGVSPEQASRWTTSDPIGVPAERLLRLIAVMGPDAIAARTADADAKLAVKLELLDLLGALGCLSSVGATASDVPIRLRRASSSWQADAIPC